jgi:ankyrin repeat protein
MVRYLVEHEADVQAKDKYERTALHISAKMGYIEVENLPVLLMLFLLRES